MPTATLELVFGSVFWVALGLLIWPLVEYAIHGLLSHRWKTFVSPLHWTHHRSPGRVFTSPLAALPLVAVVFALAAPALGGAAASSLVVGLLFGFFRYERTHWRIHFRMPRNDRERRLRSHHLAHHFRNPRAYHGVTTRLFDHVFGTLPTNWRNDYEAVADWAPLEGPSNLREVWSPIAVFREVRSAYRAGRRDRAANRDCDGD